MSIQIQTVIAKRFKMLKDRLSRVRSRSASFVRPQIPASALTVCFETPSDYEITAGGRKVAGSAQMRAQGVVLQHGAVPMYGDITRICPLLAAHPDADRVRARATTVEEARGVPVDWEEAADAMMVSFAEVLNLRLEPGTLTAEERAWAEGSFSAAPLPQ